jgi:hypothetical protein
MQSTIVSPHSQWQPYLFTPALGESFSSDTASLEVSGTNSLTDDGKHLVAAPAPNVVSRQQHSLRHDLVQLSDFPVFQQRPSTIAVLTQHLLANQAESAALLRAMIVNRSLLVRALSMARGQLVIVAVKMSMVAGSIHGHVFLESILADNSLLWMMIEGHMGGYILSALYDMASNPWRIQLHSLMIPRLAELCRHPNANYLISHALEFQRVHHDSALVHGLTSVFTDCARFASVCLDKHGMFVAVAWSRVLTANSARSVAHHWLRDPNAHYLRVTNSSPIAGKLVSSIIEHLLVRKAQSRCP